MANYFLFTTSGDWDSTSLWFNGDMYPALKLYIELVSPTNSDGTPLKRALQQGAEMTAFATPQESGPDLAIFPGKIDLEFPTHKLTIENVTPQFAIEMTRIWLDNREITDEVTEIRINIDAERNEVEAFVVILKPHLFGADEVATYALL